MNVVRSFQPIFHESCRLLILGSCPSVESITRGENYGHPRNRFWPVMAALLGEPCPALYEDKKAMLLRHGIALWDIVHTCSREGSLDSAIRDVEANDIPALLHQCPLIKAIALNGSTAYRLFLRHIGRIDGITLLQLPSTSPIPRPGLVTFDDALNAWREKLAPFLPE